MSRHHYNSSEKAKFHRELEYKRYRNFTMDATYSKGRVTYTKYHGLDGRDHWMRSDVADDDEFVDKFDALIDAIYSYSTAKYGVVATDIQSVSIEFIKPSKGE